MIVLKKIAKICKEAKCIRIDNVGERQWMGVSGAMYCMDGFPTVDSDTVMSMLDIPRDDREKVEVHIEWTDYGESPQYQEFAAGENPTERTLLGSIHLLRNGAEYMVLGVGEGIVLVDTDYIAPIKKDDGLSYHARRDADGMVVIAVKEGMILRAVIRPSYDAEIAMAKELRYAYIICDIRKCGRQIFD